MAVAGYLQSDLEQVERALPLDNIDDQNEISHDAVRYITLHPVSSDVRLIYVALKASHDFKRAADGHSIARKRVKSCGAMAGSPNAHIEKMSQLAFSMMADAITCFVEEDIDLACELIARDKAVDQLQQKNYKLLTDDAVSDLSVTTRFETLLISKSIERIGDHSKNLAEEVIYLLTGE